MYKNMKKEKMMETFRIENEIKVLCITAESFPDGIEAAFSTLNKKVPISDKRTQFGISRPDKGVITYKAAAEEIIDGEAESLGLERFVVRKGEYICELIPDFMDNIPSIGKTFQKLLKHPEIDPEGYCLEWYLNEKDVRCMVKLKN
jgi:hypothetical protein